MASEFEDVIDDEDFETGDDENEDDDVETYLLPDSSAISDPYLRDVWDQAVKELNEEADEDEDADEDDGEYGDTDDDLSEH